MPKTDALSALPIPVEVCQVDGEPIPPEQDEYRVNGKPICSPHFGELMAKNTAENGGEVY